jgi:hypothetical protein
MVGSPGEPENLTLGSREEGRGDERPIGVFDSGVGGLTVLDEMIKLLPQEHLIYFGDTARFPYGPRSIDEVWQFARQIMDFMEHQGVKMLVIACNSMTAAYEKNSYPSRRCGQRQGRPIIARSEFLEPKLR